MSAILSWFAADRSHRLLLGFDSPIHADILIAVLLPWARYTVCPLGTIRVKILLTLSLMVESCLLYLLAATGSRGPAMALLAACAVEIGLYFHVKDTGHAKLLCIRGAFTASVLILSLYICGFGDRLVAASTFTDASLHNRLEILKHARSLLLLNPLTGCGWGWSVYHYSQWFEPLHLRYLYTGLSNEYLQIGVELGVPLFFATLTSICVMLAAPFFSRTQQYGVPARISHLSYLSFIVFAIAGTMTSFHDSTTLLVLLATVVMFRGCYQAKALLTQRTWIAGLCGASCVISALFLMPAPLTTSRVNMYSTGLIELLQNDNSNTLKRTDTLVLVDQDVLGMVYGQTLRAMLSNPPFGGKMYIARPTGAHIEHYPKTIVTCIAFGASIGSHACDEFDGIKDLIIIHPNINPPQKMPSAANIRVILPQIDEAGVNESWRRYCEAHAISISMTPASGLDLQHCRAQLLNL